ncbi:MAG: YkgJ family cysteine cluster protein [Myxococcota bacterium]
MSDTVATRSLRAMPILNQTIDKRVAELEKLHHERLQCRRGCHTCCVDDLSVHEVEAAHIEQATGDRLSGLNPAPPGRCAFLDSEGACRIYEQRPYVCRTQGLPLRWLEEGIEYRDICPLNAPGSPIEELAADACWTVGAVESRLQLLQSLREPGQRVALRRLFARLSANQ